ncbi:MAG: 4'-phosphopantetheinyl transferase superfamily protein [Oscillospiraceae bacterium]|nr:4'-phosphopantetheinyl transferase superfamily protein [Oscillospiraceae bacterium]
MNWSYCNTGDFTHEDYAAAYAGLSPSRRAHIDGMKSEKARLRSLAGELLAQRLLTGLGIVNAQLHRKENGQPYLTGCDLHVSISHCEDLVVCAVSSQPVGIDVQRLVPIDLAIARHVCVEQERQYLFAPADRDQQMERFYEIWTAKEAYFKKQGTGITGLKTVNILSLDRQLFRVEDYLVQVL